MSFICTSALRARRQGRASKPLFSPKSHARALASSLCAFTLVELLVVISIMGLLAGLVVPALKNLGKSNTQAGATRQLLDDIGRARQLAISQHTTVYMVFVPTNFFNLMTSQGAGHTIAGDANNPSYVAAAADRFHALTVMTNLVDKQLSGYNFISYGQVGDQPGQHSWHYLSTWQALPQGTFIAAGKFQPYSTYNVPTLLNDYSTRIDSWRNAGTLAQIYAFTNQQVPFPTEQCSNIPVYLPCLSFDHTGRLTSEEDLQGNPHHAYIPLAHGTVAFAYDPNKNPVLSTVAPADITEVPAGNSSGISYNVVDVDPLSGRAHMLVHQLP